MRKFGFSKILVLSVFFVAFVVAGYMNRAESACGASTTNCKRCHEGQGEMKVNDGSAQHKQHAFGDFCVFCHGGDTKGKTKEDAHKGLRSPLEDTKTSCSACHPDDYEKRAAKYEPAAK